MDRGAPSSLGGAGGSGPAERASAAQAFAGNHKGPPLDRTRVESWKRPDWTASRSSSSVSGPAIRPAATCAKNRSALTWVRGVATSPRRVEQLECSVVAMTQRLNAATV